MFDRLKARWGVGPWGVLAILLTFAGAGLTVVRIKGPVLGFLLPEDAPGWLQWVTYLLVIFPIYQIALHFYALCLGQLKFFLERDRALLRHLGKPFRRRNRPEVETVAEG